MGERIAFSAHLSAALVSPVTEVGERMQTVATIGDYPQMAGRQGIAAIGVRLAQRVDAAIL